MRHRWETLTFFHWDYPVEQVQRLLPPRLTVEPWEGRAWVGLVPFYMRVRPPVGPAVPGLTTFPETNVRTYVVGPDGRPGVWFFSLDAANAPAVGVARAAYGLPYFLATMRVERHPNTVTYRSTRLLPRRAVAGHHIVVEPGEVLPEDEVGEFENYLTARFTLWNTVGRTLLWSPADHPPWTLRRARVARLEQTLVQATGLPAPGGEPLVHYSDGVDVRIGVPRISRP
jgi:uncharacterized protein YqjF (DUF2071 family)